MLPKIRNLTLRPRSGAVALTMLITLSISGTASAAVPFPGPPGTSAQTYVNLAQASSRTDGRTDFTVQFQLRQSFAATLNAANHAVASTIGCHECGAFAIGFQVVVAAKQDLVTLNADNTADATSYACIRCATLAAAYQIIFASDSRLTWEQIWGLAQVRSELQALRYSGLGPDQVQSKADALASRAVSILRGSPDQTPEFSPAINGSARQAQLTKNSGPFVDLFVKVQKRNG